MRLTLTAFGHTLTVNTAIGCPDHGEPEREVDMNGTIVEHTDTEPTPESAGSCSPRWNGSWRPSQHA